MTHTATKPLAQDPQRAWQTALEQLQMEMPRASFDSWVRDTKALSYEQGHLTIGTPSAYARDWLENRLTSTVSRLLVGIMNKAVDVDFVVHATDENDIEDGADEETETGKNEIASGNSTRYQEEVKPHRVIVIPGYALRLLAQGDLTPKELSLWVAFRQAVYFDWKKTNTPTVAKHIPHQAITRFANMSRSSYFRAINGVDELCGGMVSRLPESNPHPDNAIRWRVAMSPYLTRRDAAVIEMILTADIALAGDDDIERMDAALRSLSDMIKRHPSEYLDEISPPVRKHAATNMMTMLRRVLGLESDMPAALLEAAEALQNRLMSAFGSVVIPHHFLTTSAPVFDLTQSQMWTVIVLRDRVFYDYESGAEHNFVMAKQGLESISTWTGVSVKSLTRWFDQPAFQAFVHLSQVEIPEEEQGKGAERLRSFLGCGGEVITVQKTEPPIGFIQDGETRLPVWTKRALPLDKVSATPGQSEHYPWTKRALPLDKVSNGSGQSEHPLNNLFKPLLNPFKPHKPLPTTSPKAKTSAGGGWDMSVLLKLNLIGDKKLKKRLKTENNPATFASWMLYAYSSEGAGIRKPDAFAVSQLRDDPDAFAPGMFREMALRGPGFVRGKIKRYLETNSFERFRDQKDDWDKAFGKTPNDQLVEMGRRLLGESFGDSKSVESAYRTVRKRS